MSDGGYDTEKLFMEYSGKIKKRRNERRELGNGIVYESGGGCDAVRRDEPKFK